MVEGEEEWWDASCDVEKEVSNRHNGERDISRDGDPCIRCQRRTAPLPRNGAEASCHVWLSTSTKKAREGTLSVLRLSTCGESVFADV